MRAGRRGAKATQSTFGSGTEKRTSRLVAGLVARKGRVGERQLPVVHQKSSGCVRSQQEQDKRHSARLTRPRLRNGRSTVRRGATIEAISHRDTMHRDMTAWQAVPVCCAVLALNAVPATDTVDDAAGTRREQVRTQIRDEESSGELTRRQLQQGVWHENSRSMSDGERRARAGSTTSRMSLRIKERTHGVDGGAVRCAVAREGAPRDANRRGPRRDRACQSK